MLAAPPSRTGWRGLVLILIIALSAAALRARVVEVGMMSDDFAQHAMVEGLYPGQNNYAPFDLYAFFRDDPATLNKHVELGTVPWWTTPDLRGTVMRPLASALLSLDHALWPTRTPGAPRAWHLHSLAWLVLMLGAAGLALRRLLPAPMALLALVLMACEACYATPLAWLANRCSIISATFVALSLWAHVGWREAATERPSVRRRWLGLALVSVALALAAGEYGLAAPAYIVAYELFAAPRSSPRLAASARMRQSARAALPALALAAAWLVLHRLLGYGTTGSAVYVDPLSAPGGWLALVGERLPKLASGAVWALPADTGDMIRRFGRAWVPWTLPDKPSPETYLRAHRIVAGLLLAAAGASWLLVRSQLDEEERRRVRALAAGALLALLPLTVAPPHSRLLVCAQLGVSAVVAALILASTRRLSEWKRSSHARRLLALLPLPLAGLLTYAHTFADLRWARTYTEVLANMNASMDAAFEHGDLLGEDLGGREVIVVNAISQTVGLHGHYWLDAEGWPRPRSWRSLAMGEFAIVARRVDATHIELSSIQGAWLLSGAELFFRRSNQGITAGTSFSVPGLDIAVADDDGAGHPTRIQFGFPAALEDPRYLFLISTPQGLMRWTPPAPGKRAIIPHPQLPLVAAPD